MDPVWVFSRFRPVAHSSTQQRPEPPVHDACGVHPWWERFLQDAALRLTSESGPRASTETQPENLKRFFRGRSFFPGTPEEVLNASSHGLHKAGDILRNVALQSVLAGLPALP